MTVLEKIKRCVSLVWDFQEIYGEEDIEDFCDNELSTYTQHNEIMEYFKHLADLEKENAELKKRCYKKAVRDYCELEKENVQLKETLKTYNGCGDWDNDFHTCRVYLQHEELQKCEEQLTKAKDLLKQWLQTSKASGCDNINIVTDTEQFLSEVEK